MNLQDGHLRIVHSGTNTQHSSDDRIQATGQRANLAETNYESLHLHLYSNETYQHIRSVYRNEHQVRLRNLTEIVPVYSPTLGEPTIQGGMAGSKKYADLPDLDAAPEIYETPELTDDASTVQTNTVRTESPSPSEDAQTSHNLDRARLNREEARRRFEPAIVDTRDTNLSDAIGGYRKGYRTTHRRRRRRRREDGANDHSDFSGGGSDEEAEESLSSRLTRLKREAEEVRLELARSENKDEDDEFKDTYEHHQNGDEHEDRTEMIEGVEELSRVLDSLRSSSRRSKGETLEHEFSRQLAGHDANSGQRSAKVPGRGDVASTTTNPISAIAAFADRVTALETALGVPSMPSNTDSISILPTLNSLSSQISVLSKTIQPPSSSSHEYDHQPNLDAIADRLRSLQSDTDTLLSTRRAALQALASLHEVRHRNSNTSSSYAKFASRREARERQRDSYPSTIIADDNIDRPTTAAADPNNGGNQQRLISITTTPTTPHQTEANLFTEIFLEEQSSKITALYNTLPTIQSLQPLLPVVLERLRGLSVVHAGAASAHNEMEELENRLSAWEADLTKWREAVTSVEKGIEESKEIMKENMDVVGGMVRAVEERLIVVEGRK